MSSVHAKEFVQLVGRTVSIQKELEDFFNTSEKDNWPGIIQIANRYGFEMTAQELQAEVPEDFYLGFGKYPDKGWDKPTP